MAIRKKSSPKQKIINHAVLFKAEAKKELLETVRWYREQSEGLDKRFLQYLEDVIDSIQYNPKTYKKIYKNFRQAALKKFPYVVVYEIEAATIIVYSVFNARQHPGKKLKRLTK